MKKIQVAVLLTCLGDEGLEIYNNFSFDNDGDNNKIGIVLTKFKEYCQPRKNTLNRTI